MRVRAIHVCGLVMVVWTGASTVRAGTDVYGLGDGSDGPLSVTSGNIEQINLPTSLRDPAVQGSTAISVTDQDPFAVGDLIMIWKAVGASVPAPVSGDQAVLPLENVDAGYYELARVVAVQGANGLELDAPLLHAYAPAGTQVLKVPEYTTVTVEADAQIVPALWSGALGGIVAFVATSTVLVEGQVNASGRGLRGGATSGDDTSTGCSGLDEDSANAGFKGEGIYTSAVGAWGRGNVANGGGAGVCRNSGGGGGGHGGAGGKGGPSMDGSRDVGGLAGVSLDYSLLDALALGAGGGGGHQSTGAGGGGGDGGGAIWFRAHELAGAGIIHANGSNGSDSETDGAGGGGAGGAVYIRVNVNLRCGVISADGGPGGRVGANNIGTGGGGAGGRILVQSAVIDPGCVLRTSLGPPGVDPADQNHGAAPGAIGEIDEPFPGVAFEDTCFADQECNDRNECTVDRCNAGACSNPPVDAGTPCSTGICDGQPSARCVRCVTDDDCQDGTDGALLCDPTTGTCMGCIADADCGGDTPVCDSRDGLCVGCVDDEDCAAGVCSGEDQICVACRNDADCGEEAPICVSAVVGCVQCRTDDDCKSDARCQPDQTCLSGLTGSFAGGAGCGLRPTQQGSAPWSLLLVCFGLWVLRRGR